MDGKSIGSLLGTGTGMFFGGPVGAGVGGSVGGSLGSLFGGSGETSLPASLQPPQMNNQPGPPVQPVGAQSVGNSGPLTGGTDLASILRQILARGGTL